MQIVAAPILFQKSVWGASKQYISLTLLYSPTEEPHE